METLDLNLKSLTKSDLSQEIISYAESLTFSQKDSVILALTLAIEIHTDQEDRPDGSYVAHVLRVAVRILRFGIRDHRMVIAALIHDSVEDQYKKLAEKYSRGEKSNFHPSVARELAFLYIEKKFGLQVRTLVEFLTNPEDSHISNKDDRRAFYIQHVDELFSLSALAGLIKIADFYDNGMDLETIKDYEFRISMCKRYLPVFTIILEYKLIWSQSLSKDMSLRISNDLKIGLQSVQQQLQNVSA